MSAGLQAVMDLLRRYGVVVREAWRNRVNLEPPVRSRKEAEFLPAALALRDTPVHPAPRVAMWLIVSFAAIALGWVVLGHVDVVATAPGRIVPDSHVKLVQSLETGMVTAIYVRDGQRVTVGEPLIELDETVAAADIRRLSQDLLAAHLEVARNRALLEAQETGMAVQLNGFAGDRVERSRLLTEQRLAVGRYQSYSARLEQFDAELEARDAERRAITANMEKLRETLPIVTARARDFQGLMERNFVSRHGFLELEQQRIETELDLAAQRERLAQVVASRVEVEKQKSYFQAETRREWLDQLHEAERRLVTYEEELLKAESKGRSMTLRAPVEGVVQQLSVHTVGGVVTPAQTLMVVVPGDRPLEIEALLPNKDIGFVGDGQAVEVKVETFSFTKYGTLQGEIVHVSRDAIQDERLGLVFAVRARMTSDTILVDGRPVALSPGMAVTVEIKTGKRRLVEYFLGPLLQYSQESFRER